MAASRSASRGSRSARSRETSAESAALRPGASPSQNGMPGAAPPASSTRTTPDSMRRMRQEVLPSRKTSPAMLSTAKSSSTCPTATPSGSATTWYWALSGMAPPPVRAAMRAPATAADHVVHAVPVEERPGPAAPGGGALGEHGHDGVELPTRELAVGPGPPAEREELVLADRPRRRLGHDLLGEDVERARGAARWSRGARRGARGRAPRTRGARPGSWGRSGLSGSRPASGRSGRRAAAPRGAPPGCPAGPPGRPCRCRCPARARRWRRWP